MFKAGLWLFLVLFTGGAFAQVPPTIDSAKREKSEDYRVYKYRAKWLAEQSEQPAPYRTPLDEATTRLENLPRATRWPSMNVLNEAFARFRDYRFLTDSERPNFLRRSTWLFPDDGCYARASLANRNLKNWNYPVPKKVFVFGNLLVETPNSPLGEVSWWYHVAPIVEVHGRKYVMDPAIEPRRPLTLQAWLKRMHQRPGRVEVAICASGTYTPNDSCERETDGVEEVAETVQKFFLADEWYRVLDLGRNPEQELGDSPPWLN